MNKELEALNEFLRLNKEVDAIDAYLDATAFEL